MAEPIMKNSLTGEPIDHSTPTLCQRCNHPECRFYGSYYNSCTGPEEIRRLDLQEPINIPLHLDRSNTAASGSEELNELVSRLRNLQREVAALEEEIEATKDLIKEQLTTQGVDTLLGPDYKVTWKEVTRTSLDTKRLREAEPELCKQFERSATYRQFLLK